MSELDQYSTKALVETLAYRLNADLVPRSRYEEVLADREALEERESNRDKQPAVSNELLREMELVRHLAVQYGWDESPLVLHGWLAEKLDRAEEVENVLAALVGVLKI